MYETKCPACNQEDSLHVIGGVYHALGMPLQSDGFSFSDADQVDTEDDTVECYACKKMFSLDELYREEPPPPPEKHMKLRD